MSQDLYKYTIEILPELDKLEKEKCNLPQVFAEVLKDEINANNEYDLYHNVKDFISKYSKDANSLKVINEFTKAISGGASLNEILQITREEVTNPSISTGLTTEDECDLENNR